MEDFPFTVNPDFIGPAVRVRLSWVHTRQVAGLGSRIHEAMWQRGDMPIANGVYEQMWAATMTSINDGVLPYSSRWQRDLERAKEQAERRAQGQWW